MRFQRFHSVATVGDLKRFLAKYDDDLQLAILADDTDDCGLSSGQVEVPLALTSSPRVVVFRPDWAEDARRNPEGIPS